MLYGVSSFDTRKQNGTRAKEEDIIHAIKYLQYRTRLWDEQKKNKNVPKTFCMMYTFAFKQSWNAYKIGIFHK